MYDKEEMINKLEEAKSIVCDVYDETDNLEVGDIMCCIDEAVASLEDK